MQAFMVRSRAAGGGVLLLTRITIENHYYSIQGAIKGCGLQCALVNKNHKKPIIVITFQVRSSAAGGGALLLIIIPMITNTTQLLSYDRGRPAAARYCQK